MNTYRLSRSYCYFSANSIVLRRICGIIHPRLVVANGIGNAITDAQFASPCDCAGPCVDKQMRVANRVVKCDVIVERCHQFSHVALRYCVDQDIVLLARVIVSIIAYYYITSHVLHLL